MAPLYFISCWVYAGAIRDGYNPVRDAISRLAELGAPNRYIVTSGMVVFGVGCLLFAGLLRKPASISMTVAGLASFGVAAFPCTEGCPGFGSLTDTAHILFAGLHYVSFGLTPVLHSRKPVVLTIAGLAGLALLIQATGLGPNGLFQRIGLTTLDAWLIATASRKT